MAATSASPLSISLPSIHEMFPEHLLRITTDHRLRISAATSNALLSQHSSTMPHVHRENHMSNSGTKPQIYSFDVLRSDPSSSSLQHIASSATLLNRPSAILGPNRASDRSVGSTPLLRVNIGSSSGSTNRSSSTEYTHAAARPRYPHIPSSLPSDPDQVTYSSDEVSDDGDDKKHVLLCGREFNVNSNMRRHYRNHLTPSRDRPQGKEDCNVTASSRRRKRRTSRSPPTTTQCSARSPTDNDYLVQRPDVVPMYPPSYETRGSGKRNVPFGFLTHESSAPSMAEVSEESDAESSIAEEDELMDEDECSNPFYTHRTLSPYRLQPVSDFHDRYSTHTLPSRYEQSDIRSLPPPSRPNSNSSSSSSPPPSPPISPGSVISGTSPTGLQGTSPSTAFRR
ncbi:hypothetical protein F5890DRAFT_1554753 [Lentinula detonsa]|uniref:Uncharacterized protein n=1 Tax=Lentinula detonsa TaxID=2804962 RepID=A0AA38UTJ9_9AGAR|nr:hypothetical protein F5890DRAFT_1554753 [Lentinula detonsa]